MRLQFAAALLLAVSLSAGTTITSISPVSGPTSGGTAVTIKGSEFGYCIICSPPLPPPRVFFDGTPATIVEGSDDQLIVSTPPHFQGLADVTVEPAGRPSVTIENAFTFEGATEEALEPILVPVWIAGVDGAYGSRFEVTLNGWNRGLTPLPIYGLQTCMMPACEPDSSPHEAAVMLEPGGLLRHMMLMPNGTPGRLLWIPTERADELILTMRAFDTSREATTNFGTEVPIARIHDFRESITLPDIPLNPRFRKLLRIYGLSNAPASVLVQVGNADPVEVELRPGAHIFEPSYAEYSGFPPGTGWYLPVHVTQKPQPGGAPPVPPAPIWAFVSVTNNETQHVTVISPQ